MSNITININKSNDVKLSSQLNCIKCFGLFKDLGRVTMETKFIIYDISQTEKICCDICTTCMSEIIKWGGN